MKKTAKLLLTLTILFVSIINTKAQTTAAPDKAPVVPFTDKLKVGIALDGLAVNGQLKEVSNLGFGADVRLQYKLGHEFDLTLTSGYYNLYTKAGIPTTEGDLTLLHGKYYVGVPAKQSLIPVKLGIKKFVNENIYIGVEGGVAFETQFDLNKKLLLSGGAGYAIDAFDFGLRYESFSGQSYNYGIIGLRVAYAFGF